MSIATLSNFYPCDSDGNDAVGDGGLWSGGAFAASGGPTHNAGRIDYGETGNHQISRSIASGDDWTISFWHSGFSSSGWFNVTRLGSSTYLGVQATDDGGTAKYKILTDSGDLATFSTTSGWHHHVIKREGGTLTWLVDGTSRYSGANAIAYADIYVGGVDDHSFSEWGFWSGALTSRVCENLAGTRITPWLAGTMLGDEQVALLMDETSGADCWNSGTTAATWRGIISTTTSDTLSRDTLPPQYSPLSIVSALDSPGDEGPFVYFPVNLYSILGISSGANISDLSLSCWVRLDANASTTATFTKRAFAFYHHTGSARLYSLSFPYESSTQYVEAEVYVGGVQHLLRAEVNINEWHHYAISWGSDTVTLYVDGIAVDSEATSGQMTVASGGPRLCGSGATGGYQSLPGMIKDFRIFDSELTRSDVLLLTSYTAPTPAKRLWPISRRPPLFLDEPFSGQGISIYAASTSDSLVYRKLRMIGSRPPLRVATDFPLGENSMAKTARIASQSGSAGAAVEATVDLSAFTSDEIQVDVRHYNDDVENEVISPRRITLDANGDQSDEIRGNATLLDYEIRAGGVVRIRWRWIGAPTGVQPDEFVVARTAGPTSPSDVTVTSVGDGIYSADTPALSDSSAYTYKITAQTTGGSTTRDVLTGISFTADATGPAAPGSLTVTTA